MPSVGAWIAVDPEDIAASELHSSEIKAFRAANATPMIVAEWPFGKTLAEVIAEATAPK